MAKKSKRGLMILIGIIVAVVILTARAAAAAPTPEEEASGPAIAGTKKTIEEVTPSGDGGCICR